MKIQKNTIFRTIVMFVALINSILVMIGKNPLPFSDEEIYQGLSAVATVLSTIWAWWKNNSFTPEAIEADEILKSLKKKEVSELGGDAYTFDNWVKTFIGKKLDPDKQFGVQCVDLIKHYCRNVLEIQKSFFDTWGNAIDWYNNYGKSGNWQYLKQNFSMITFKPGTKIQKGDIAVFKSKSQYGHIAVCTGCYNTKTFTAYDQNYNGTGAGMTLREFAYDGTRTLVCLLRPKNQKNIAEPVKVTPVKKPTATKVTYYPQYKGKSLSLVDALASLKIDSSLANRKKIAKANAITNYTGTATQNIKLLNLLKQGKLKK